VDGWCAEPEREPDTTTATHTTIGTMIQNNPSTGLITENRDNYHAGLVHCCFTVTGRARLLLQIRSSQSGYCQAS
jgi:hypothetical protein